MKVWIDLATAPHPLLFEPVATALGEAGARLRFTARDHAETLELARERWPHVEAVGGPSPGARAAKARALGARAAGLARWSRRERPDVALSHNSYAQILAAAMTRVPAVTAMDFEHQPANHLAFRLARRILLPEALPLASVARQGARPGKVARYPGLKEELELSAFEPDPGVLERVGVERADGTAVVVARTPPAGASYHRFANPLFWEAMRALGRQEHVRCVLLARGGSDVEEAERMQIPNITVPRRAVDARSLLVVADLFIGGGGTMTREAALLGVPTLSAFAGRRPAVDAWLEGRGAIARLDSPRQLDDIRPRPRERPDLDSLRDRGRRIAAVFAVTTLTAPDRPGTRS